jgi:hypothetical protein
MSLQNRLAASAKHISLAIFVSLVSLELFSFAATKFELLPFKDQASRLGGMAPRH